MTYSRKIKGFLSLTAFILLLLLNFVILKPPKSTEGVIYVTITYTYEYEYTPNDTLADVLKRHHDVKIQNCILYNIDSLHTDFITYYIAIYINDDYSMYGVCNIPLCDGCRYEFRLERVR